MNTALFKRLTPDGPETLFFFRDRTLTAADARRISQGGVLPENGMPFTPGPDYIFDLSDLSGKYMPAEDAGIVYAEIESPEEEDRYLGLGVDWWFTCYVNGNLAGTCEPRGNHYVPVSPFDHIYPVHLHQGLNRIAVHVRPGGVSWQFAMNLISAKAILPGDGDVHDLFLGKVQYQRLLNGPLIHRVSTDRAAVAFSFSMPAAGGIRINGTELWSNRYGLKTRKKVHRFELTGLKPDTEYPLEVLMVDESTGMERVVGRDVVRTFPASGTDFSFTLLSDTQLIPPERIRALKDFQKNCQLGNGKFFISLGDVDSEFEDFEEIYFDTFINPLKSVEPGLPAFQPVRGNHEFRGTDTDQYYEWFGAPYYTFRYGDVFFIVIDTGEDKDLVSKPYHYTLRTDTDQLLRDEKEFLEQVVASEEYKNAKFRIVLSHAMPVDCGSVKQYYTDRMEVFAAPLLRNENHEYPPVDLWLCADVHRSFRYDPAGGTLFVEQGDEARRLTAGDIRRVPCPVYVNDGPGGEGEQVSMIRVEVQPRGFRLSICAADGKIMDCSRFEPGKAVVTEETSYIAVGE